MTARFRPILQATYLPSSLTTLYTAAGGQRVRIDRCSVTNQTGSAVTITLHVRPSAAGSDENEHRIYIALSIPGDGIPVELPAMLRTLSPGDQIKALASSANAVSIFADGVILT